jgi:hypothetical protein
LFGVENAHADRIAFIDNRGKTDKGLAFLDKLVSLRQVVEGPADAAGVVQLVGGNLVEAIPALAVCLSCNFLGHGHNPAVGLDRLPP